MTDQPLAPLPAWMMPPGVATRQEFRDLQRANERVMFEAIFDRMMDLIASGQPLAAALERDPREPDYAKFLAWVMRDEARRERYYEAQAVGAEVVAQQMLTIADAADTVEDVQRSTLRIGTRKWLLGVWNRKRFGDVKQIDQHVTIDMVGAMQEARERAERGRVIDVQARRIEP